MENLFVFFLLLSVFLTILCALWQPRTGFGTLLLLGGAYVIAITFAGETDVGTIAFVGGLGLLPFAGILVHSILHLVRRSDAWEYRGAGMHGAFFLWQRVRITGAPAWLYWLTRTICAALITITLAGGLAIKWRRVAARSEPTPPENVEPAPESKPSDEDVCRQLVEQAQPLVAECRRLGQPRGRVPVLGKVLILDLETMKPRKANNYLPAALRGQPTDPEFTLVMVVEKHRTQVASYAESGASDATGIPGYRVDLDVAIVHWPARKPVGLVRVMGENPPESVSVRQWSAIKSDGPAAIAGWFDRSLADWLASLPTVGRPDPVGDALALAADAADRDVVAIRGDSNDKFEYLDGSLAPKLKGRALIWDATHDRLAGKANSYLPENLRGTLGDRDLTLFVVNSPSVERTGTDDFATGKGSIEGYIVHWPDRKLVGRFKLSCGGLLGYSLPGNFQFDDDNQVAVESETGLLDTMALKLARWVKSLAGP